MTGVDFDRAYREAIQYETVRRNFAKFFAYKAPLKAQLLNSGDAGISNLAYRNFRA